MKKAGIFIFGMIAGIIMSLAVYMAFREGPTDSRPPLKDLGNLPNDNPSVSGTAHQINNKSPKDEKDEGLLHEGDLTDKRIAAFKVDNVSVGNCVLRLANVEDISMGVELISGDHLYGSARTNDVLVGSAKRFSLDLEGVTLKKVLDAIVEADPRYEWSEDNWVINLKPRGAPGKAGLDDRIEVFVAIGLDLCGVIDRMLSPLDESIYLERLLPKDFDHAKALEFKEFNVSFSETVHAMKSLPKKMSFVLLNPSARDILNAILRQQGRGSWICLTPDIFAKDPMWSITFCIDKIELTD